MTAIVTKNPRVQLLFHRTPPARRKVETFGELRGTVSAVGVSLAAVPSFAITAFQGPGPQEIGADLVTPSFTAAYTQPPDVKVLLTDSVGSPAKNVLVPDPEAFSSDGTFTKTLPLEEVGFILTAQAAGFSAVQATFAVPFWPRVFVGVEDPLAPGGGSEAFIEALASNNLQGSVVGDHALTVVTGKRIFWAAPVSLGTPVFQIDDSLPGGMTDINDILVTAGTPNAVPVLYRLWMSQYGGFGATTLHVTEAP